MMHITTLSITVFLLLCKSAHSARGGHPCHSRSFETIGATCEHVIIPPSLCLNCRLRKVDADGKFPDCANIYNLDQSCRAGIGEYVTLNPCDTKRKAQFEAIDKAGNVELLDYFVYAVCEECCDCVPFKAKATEFLARRNVGKGRLTSLRRGNCPAHVRFDVCAVWPMVRDVLQPGNKAREGLPKICPLLNAWI